MKKKRARSGITIGGYYGYGNVGDEAVLFSVLSMLSKRLPASRVFVLTRDPSSVPRVGGVEIIPKSRRSPFAVIGAFLSSQLYISGGGSLFQDKTSQKSLAYYCSLVRLAKLCGCKVCILSNGIGPLKNEKRCQRALCSADMVSLRDGDSFETAKRLMRGAVLPSRSADPVFAYPFENESSDELPIPEGPYIAVSLRGLAVGGEGLVREAEQAFLGLSRKRHALVFVSMQDSFDLEIARTMAKITGGTFLCPKEMGQLFRILKGADAAIGMRLHFLICAAMAGVPTVPIVYDPKVEGCMRELGISCSLRIGELNESTVVSALESAMGGFPAEEVKRACGLSRKRALFDMECAAELLGEPLCTEEEGKFFADT